jgi:hypothetical protein
MCYRKPSEIQAILPEGTRTPARETWALMYNCGPAAGVRPGGHLNQGLQAFPAVPDPGLRPGGREEDAA